MMTEPSPRKPETPRRASGRLGRRLLLWVLLISLGPLLVSNGWGYVRSELIIEGLVQRYLGGIADLQAGHVGERMDGLSRSLEDLGSRSVVAEAAAGRGDPEALVAYLEGALREYPEFDALYLFDESGDIAASAPLPPVDLVYWIGPPLEPPHRPIDVRREEEPPYYPYVRLSVPVPRVEGEASRHHLGATMTLAAGQSFLELPPHAAGSVETIVVDTEGRPIFVSHPHGHVDYGARFASPLLEGDAGGAARYEDRQGVAVLGTVVAVPGQPWRLISEVPAAEALQELRELRAISLWLAWILAVVVLAAAWFVAGRIVAPVSALVSATRLLGSGRLSARVDPTGDDEIGELGASFNRMAAELEETSALAKELHQKELERAAQLATVGELAAGVAHEIKNPIAGIAGGMDLITKRLPDDPDLARIVKEMRRQTARVDGALRDLLSFARPVDPQLAPTDLNVVADRAQALVAAAAEKADVTIREELAPDLPSAQADAELLGQCLVNLMMNAIQAAGSGGRVEITTSSTAAGVAVSIADSGPGIGPTERDKIFRPFYTTKHQGTGLGLSITASIVEGHGGRITVESEPGQGATFTVWLPVLEPDRPARTSIGIRERNRQL